MKIFFTLSLLLMGVTHAATLSSLQGTYLITHPELPVVNEVSLTDKGDVLLLEKGPFGEFQCEGKAKLVKNILTSSVKCENGKSFNQRIDFSKVKKFNSFSAPVYSSLYGVEVLMNFKKIN